MEKNTKFNADKWVEIYEKTSFGNRYPSSYLVSVYHRIIKENLPKTENRVKVLDFGCSFGANSQMLRDYGLDVYGIDISEDAINFCIDKYGFDAKKFIACDILSENMDYEAYANKFDLIIASEILYYFSSSDMDRILDLFYKFLKKDGVIYANMPAYNYAYLNGKVESCSLDETGMVRVENSGAASEPLYVRVVKDKTKMREIFHIFEEIATLRTMVEIKGEDEKFHFIGRKWE